MTHADEELVSSLEQALLSVDRVAARRVVRASEGSLSPIQTIERVVSPTLERIGACFDCGKVSLAQIYMAGRIAEELVDSFLPLKGESRGDQKSVALAVLEDYHLLGKRIIYSVLRASGFNLKDYGRVDVDGLVSRVIRDSVEVLLISTLMLRSALLVRQVRARLDESGRCVKIVVGGAPFRLDRELWRSVGADAAGYDSADAVRIVRGLVGGKP